MNCEKYEKENNSFLEKNIKKENLHSDLIKCIIQTREDLQTANNNFEFAEGELIDYYLYQIKATKSKYNYLIKKAKNLGLIVNRTDNISFKSLDEAM